MKADLHVHTDISDGSLNLMDTLKLAKQNNITHIAITNHDTVKGLSEAVIMGEQEGIKVIPGIEISAYNFNTSKKVHILGFKFDINGINITKLCGPVLERRNSNSLWQITQLINNGYKINMENILYRARNSGIIYKQHIMAELTDRKYTDEQYGQLYKKLFKNDGICARDIEYVSAENAVRAIKADGGIAVLAHPGQLDSYEIIQSLVKEGLDGIELYHEDHDEEDHRKINEYCDRYGLITTGGSDYHGCYGKIESIGQVLSSPKYMYVFDKDITNN